MKRCRSCLYPVTKPDLPFNEDGICSACLNYSTRPEIDWDERFAALERLLDAHNGDVLVPSSGGKDSTYIALRLKELGASVTALTCSTDYLTPMGRANIENLKRHVNTIEFTPDTRVRAALCRKALELVGDVSWPEHVLIHRVPFWFAHNFRIPLVFYGECPNNQYGGPEGTADTKEMTQRWVSEFGGFLGLRAEDFVSDEISLRDMDVYREPPETDAFRVGFLGWYEPWDSQRNAEYAIARGLEYDIPSPANWWAWENLDNALTGLHDHGMYRKYGYGRGVAQISVDIRAGRISRERAVEVMEGRDGLFPYEYAHVPIGDVLEWLGLRPETLIEHLDEHTNWELFKHVVHDGRPVLKEFDAQD